MKKLLSIALLICFALSITACQDEQSKMEDYINNILQNEATEGRNTNKEQNTIINNTEKFKEEKLEVYYDPNEKSLNWNSITDVRYYTISLNNKTYIEENRYIDVSFLNSGHNYDATITAYKDAYTVSETITFKTPGFNENVLSDVKNIYSKSIVKIKIERYNTILGIKTDKISETIEGVICKVGENKTYWVATYSPLLRTTGGYDNTKFWITDYNGCTIEAVKTKLTDYNGNEITILKYRDPFSNNPELPAIKFANSINEYTKDILTVQTNPITQCQTNKILNVKQMTIHGTKSKTPLIKTFCPFPKSYGCAILNSDFELVGISVGAIDDRYYAIQIAEVLKYIDEHLAMDAELTLRMSGYGVE